MTINRRKIRASLGSRTARRLGTKTKVIKGMGGKRPPKFRNPRKSLNRVARRMRLKVRELLAKGGAA